MRIIKKQISIPNLLSYNKNSYMAHKSKYVYLSIYIDQTFDLMGLANLDELHTGGCKTCPSVPQYTYNKATDLDKRIDSNVNNYYVYGARIETVIDSKLDNYQTYNQLNSLQQGFDIKQENYINYMGVNIDGRTRITSINNKNTIYTVDAHLDGLIGTTGQTSGLLYTLNDFDETTVSFNGEGMNMLNTELKPIYKKEKNLGLIWPTEVYSDIFINRSRYSVSERHIRLSEINTTKDLKNYYNSFYKILTNGY